MVSLQIRTSKNMRHMRHFGRQSTRISSQVAHSAVHNSVKGNNAHNEAKISKDIPIPMCYCSLYHWSIRPSNSDRMGHLTDDGLCKGCNHFRQVRPAGYSKLQEKEHGRLVSRKCTTRLHWWVAILVAERDQFIGIWWTILLARSIQFGQVHPINHVNLLR